MEDNDNSLQVHWKTKKGPVFGTHNLELKKHRQDLLWYIYIIPRHFLVNLSHSNTYVFL